MYAIVQTGGKQYKVETGDQIRVEKIDGEPGTEVVLDKVLAIADNESIQLGTPLIQDRVVKATILRTDRNRKIVVFKKKRRKAYDKKQGHRQWFTLLRIDSIASAPNLITENSASSQTALAEA
ncbi:MAG: 50S ribosomal protein L21 [Desulfomonile sp.]|nr:50S ribosomal protein L21 [Desulfomonile sp.]